MVGKEIVDYASENLSKGYSADEVKAAILTAGWTQAEADEAVAEAQKPKPTLAAPVAKPKKSNKTLWIIITLILVAAIGIAVAFYLNLVNVNDVPVLRDVLATPIAEEINITG